ncbi:hypothetical protein DNTS_025923 [Danionella cerebrum]|uniref:Prion protein n=1 Tax=Danionella cerebrum TaxID=2873325 RepID=A0A553MX03_9TELE|nr:hypothetical protein DNTS_025923 [Danionella translucida]
MHSCSHGMFVTLRDQATPRTTSRTFCLESEGLQSTELLEKSSWIRMDQLQKYMLLVLVLTAVLHNISEGKKANKHTPSKKPADKPSQGTKTHSSYPKQPSSKGAGNIHGNPSEGGYGNTGGGGYSQRGYPKQNPGWYPAGGSYPVRPAGQPGGFPGGQSATGVGYPNWNPNNRILSPRYGGSFGGGGGNFAMGGSPFSHSVKSMGYGPSEKSKGFGKQAVLAAGVGGMAGVAVGYGIGNFQRPNTQFHSHQEERHYNNYMYQRQQKPNVLKPSYTSESRPTQKTQVPLPSEPQSYDQFITSCMKRHDLLKEQETKDSTGLGNNRSVELTSTSPKFNERNIQNNTVQKNATASQTGFPERKEDDITVSILQIEYPALIKQMKSQKCVELYIVYAESFLAKEKELQKKKTPTSFKNHNGHNISGVLLLLTSSIMLF